MRKSQKVERLFYKEMLNAKIRKQIMWKTEVVEIAVEIKERNQI